MSFVDSLGAGLNEAFFMFWATLWALVLGFTLSGAVRAFVSRTQMQQTLGDHTPKTLAKSSFFGMVSSSCSYASAALAKSLFSRGADFTAAGVHGGLDQPGARTRDRAVAADRLAVRAR